jgi:hypothetical protein
MENKFTFKEKMLRDILLTNTVKPKKHCWDQVLWDLNHTAGRHEIQALQIHPKTKEKSLNF